MNSIEMKNLNYIDLSLNALRLIFAITLLLVIDALGGLGTNLLLLYATIILAILSAKKVAALRYSTTKLVSALLASFILSYTLFSGLAYIPSAHLNWPLKLSALEDHVFLIQGILVLCLVSGIFFWRYASCLTFEIAALASLIISLFAAHRNYRFDLIQVLSDLAWYFQSDLLSTILTIGIILAVSSCLYFYFGTHPKRSYLNPNIKSKIFGEKVKSRYNWQVSAAALCLLVLATIIWRSVYNYHSEALETRLKNGVGDNNQEGVSPLNFHSSLGGSSAAVAIVRLEGDYPGNPQSPLLYFREAAVSLLSKNTLVIAPPKFNPDISNTNPKEFYRQKQDLAYDYREPLNQSIYLLSKHNLAFAIDYPISIVELKLNSKQNRFLSAYRAYSMVPTYKLEQLEKIKFGSHDWSAEIWEHFTKKHPDPRYFEKAKEITSGAGSKLEKVLAITNYLSKKSIYTLRPNHEVDDQNDPVAPYLFGDLRGYCVHFAHAITYLLRALDIPARVATGYMTDLSQSRDGHILLRMNDRHAWPEAYIENLGWVPFDIQPEQVELHAETPVDADVLEELMGLIDPGEEIIPKDIGRDEIGLQEKSNPFNLKVKSLAVYLLEALLYLYLLILVLNLLSLHAWRCIGGSNLKVKLYYRALLYKLASLGFPRNYGETLPAYSLRLKLDTPIKLKQLEILDEIYFAPKQKNSCEFKENIEIKSTLKNKKELLQYYLKVILSYLNPLAFIKVLFK